MSRQMNRLHELINTVKAKGKFLSSKNIDLFEKVIKTNVRFFNNGLDISQNPRVARLQEAVMLRESGGGIQSVSFSKIEQYILTILSRALPGLIAPEIVSTQPVQSELAMVRILRWKYELSKGSVSRGESGLGSFESPVSFSPYYSSPKIIGEKLNRTPYTVPVGNTTVTVMWHADDLSVNTTETALWDRILEYPLTSPSLVVHYNIAGVGTGQSLSDKTVTGTVTLNSTDWAASVTIEKYDGTNDLTIKFKYDFGTNQLSATATSSPQQGTADLYFFSVDYDYETNTEALPASPEMSLTVEKIPIEAEVRKLRAKMTAEAFVSAKSHNMELEAEVLDILSDEVRMELDRTILADLLQQTQSAYGTTSWNKLGAPSGFALTENDWYRTLLASISQLSAAIFRRTRRGPANWIVTSPEVAALLESTGLVTTYNTDSYNPIDISGLVLFGYLQKRWKLIVDPLFPRDQVLIGYKGVESEFDSGYIYAPFLPVLPVMKDTTVPDFSYHIGVYTAAGWKMIDNGFYACLKVENIDKPWST